MRRFASTMVFGVLAAVSMAAASCGGAKEESAQEAAAATRGGDLTITFSTAPDPPVLGENTFNVTVTDGSQPVSDADVSVQFYMAAMPEMKMPEMRNTVALRHDAEGRYRGKGSIVMAGKWEATVTVVRDGRQIGSRTLDVTAQ